jgi:hypothetical protein
MRTRERRGIVQRGRAEFAAIVELLMDAGRCENDGSGRPPLRCRASHALGDGRSRRGPLSTAPRRAPEAAEAETGRARLAVTHMHALVVALFLQILVVEYLVQRRGLLSPYFVLIPELLSGIVMLVVLLRLMNGTRVSLDWRYGLFIVVLLFTIAFGWAV